MWNRPNKSPANAGERPEFRYAVHLSWPRGWSLSGSAPMRCLFLFAAAALLIVGCRTHSKRTVDQFGPGTPNHRPALDAAVASRSQAARLVAAVAGSLAATSNLMKNIGCVLLIGLLIGTNGCMTYSSVQKGKGQYNVVTGDNPSEPHPAYFALLPLTVPLDVATSPIQLLIYALASSSP